MSTHLLSPLQVPQGQHLRHLPTLWLYLHQNPEFVADWIKATPLNLEAHNARADKSLYDLGVVPA